LCAAKRAVLRRGMPLVGKLPVVGDFVWWGSIVGNNYPIPTLVSGHTP
jgi:hypothetical protein